MNRRSVGTALSLASRLARREVRRRPGRTLLVALLVALPVAGMLFADVWIRSDVVSAGTRWSWVNGTADAAIPPSSAVADDAALPAGSTWVTFRVDQHRSLVTVSGRRVRITVADLPIDAPLAAGMTSTNDGRAPTAPGEVWLSRRAATGLGVRVGDELQLTRPAVSTWRVVGIGRWHENVSAAMAVITPDAAYPWRPIGDRSTMWNRTLIDLPAGISSAALDGLAGSGAVELSPPLAVGRTASDAELGAPDKSDELAWSWVLGAVVLIVMGIVISAAFASGARRQLTTLGQLAANGAERRTLRATLALQGGWTGVLGVAGGIGLAAVALWATRGVHVRVRNLPAAPYVIQPLDLIPVAVLGIAACTASAMIPARGASRVPVLAALAGRRPLGVVSRRVTAAGLAGVGGGLALLALAAFGASQSGDGSSTVWLGVAVVGTLALLLGMCAASPAYVMVLGAVARVGGSRQRLAARSLLRQRTRTSAVVAAIAATAGLAVAAASLIGANQASAGSDGIPADEVQLQLIDAAPVGGRSPAVPAELSSQVQAVIPAARVHVISVGAVPGAPAEAQWWTERFEPTDAGHTEGPGQAVMPGTDQRWFGYEWTIADDALVAAYRLDSAARTVLADDGAVIVADGVSGVATMVFGTSQPGDGDQQPDQRLDVRVVPAGTTDLRFGPTMLITPQRAADIGLVPVARVAVLRSPDALTTAQRDAIDAVIEDWNDDHDIAQRVNATMHRDDDSLSAGGAERILAGVALVACLFIVATSLALAAAETRDERDVLSVIGASPATLGRTSVLKAWMLATLGGALAVPLGVAPVWVVQRATSSTASFFMPWQTIAVVAVVVPVVAAAVTWVGSAISLAARPVRISTMALD